MCEFFNRPREIRLVKEIIEVCDHILSNLSHEVAHAFVSLRHCLKWVLRHALTSVDWDQRSLQRAFEGALNPTQGAIILESSFYEYAISPPFHGQIDNFRHAFKGLTSWRARWPPRIRVESQMDAMQEIHRMYRNIHFQEPRTPSPNRG